MTGPTLYERWAGTNVFDTPRKPMVLRSRTSDRWWVVGRGYLATCLSWRAAIAYATQQRPEDTAQAPRGRIDPASVDADTGTGTTSTVEGV